MLEAPGSVIGGTYRGRDGLLALAAVSTRAPGGREACWQTAEVFILRPGRVVPVRLYTDTELLAAIAR